MSESIVTQPAETQGLRYDPTTIALHWTTAILVTVLWIIGQTVDFPPTTALRNDYRSVHIVLGVSLAIVLLARMAWRLTGRKALPPTDQGLLLLIARFDSLRSLHTAVPDGRARYRYRLDAWRYAVQPGCHPGLRPRQSPAHPPDPWLARFGCQYRADRRWRACRGCPVPSLHHARRDATEDAALGVALASVATNDRFRGSLNPSYNENDPTVTA